MAKNKAAAKATTAAPAATSKRSGYKRKTNRRVNVLDAQRKALNKAQYDKTSTISK